MDDMLSDLQPKCAVAYINDITIFSKSMEQHSIDVGNVFQRLDLVNLKINLDKCCFVQDEIKILGHIVNGNGIKPNPNKVKII